MPKIDDRILEVLRVAQPKGEYEIALSIYPWNETNRSKHGAWIRAIVQALWRLEQHGIVGHFWESHGDGVPGDRIWVRYSEGGEASPPCGRDRRVSEANCYEPRKD